VVISSHQLVEVWVLIAVGVKLPALIGHGRCTANVSFGLADSTGQRNTF